MSLVESLRSAGVGAQVDRRAAGDVGIDAVLTLRRGDDRSVFAVEERRRAPYPNEIAGLDARLASLRDIGHPLLVAPFVSDSVGETLTAAGWSWADEAGNFDLRAPGLLLRQRATTQRPRRRSAGLPGGSGGTAIIRALIRCGEREDAAGGASVLARLADVTQPRASQVLGQLADLGLVTKTGRGRWRPDRDALLDRFLVEYPGPGGSQQFFYSLDAPNEVAVALAGNPATRDAIGASADVGPDLVAAWRKPSVLIVYARHELDVDGVDLVSAQGADDANVIVRYPVDASVFATPRLSTAFRGVDVPLADPSQMLWDLQELGGADRCEAAGRLREWLLTTSHCAG
jgi:DNA-binding transcriptional ArsR family regulator